MNIPNTLRDIARELEKINLPVSHDSYAYPTRHELTRLKKQLRAALSAFEEECETAVFLDGYYNGATATIMLNRTPQHQTSNIQH